MTIVNDNLVTWAHGNFDPAKNEVVEQHGMPYDFNSVMHYAGTVSISWQFSPVLYLYNPFFFPKLVPTVCFTLKILLIVYT